MSSDPQTRAQGDFASRLSADSFFADIAVLEQAKGVTQSDVEVALGVLNEKGGKIGAVAIVLMPELLPSTPDAPGPEYRVRATVQVITAALFNDGDQGTGKSAERIARRVRQILHRYNGGLGTWSFAGMEPLPVADGQVSYGVAFTRLGRDERLRKLGMPLIDPEEGDELPLTVTLTAAAEAAIYYTLDGSYPSPGNAAASLYEEPIEIAVATTLRAVAYLDGWQPSDAALASFGDSGALVGSFSTEFSDEFA